MLEAATVKTTENTVKSEAIRSDLKIQLILIGNG